MQIVFHRSVFMFECMQVHVHSWSFSRSRQNDNAPDRLQIGCEGSLNMWPIQKSSCGEVWMYKRTVHAYMRLHSKQCDVFGNMQP